MSTDSVLNTHLINYINDTKSPTTNFNLGYYYETLGHTSSAISFYLRTAELGDDILLTYESLLRVSLCLQKQGNRIHSLKGVLLRAISILPERPEAYFLLARIYEINKEWHETYAMSTIGEKLIEDSNIKLQTDVEYPGKYGFTFEKAVAAWWIGLLKESVKLFRELDKNVNMLDIHTAAVKNNIKNLSGLVDI